ncbi:glycosyltransferase family 2 protein [Burkholderia gladioli]|uniref:glycosyltransferase family 2 protein n=2 Tax=Burkholderia gladioli TaxID=28095 RepID=UPI001ABA54D8|nr:glycosyltransferase [Burkholderia gladioli]
MDAMQATIKNPTVSVVLPVYNGKAYLGEMLDSISLQQFRDFEVVVVDDGSSDDSWSLLTEWASRQEFHVKLQRKPLNFGVCAALTDATSLAAGKYIAQIGQDDIWLPGHLASLVDALDSNYDASAAFARVAYIDAHSAARDASVFKHARIEEVEAETLLAWLTSGNFLCAPASMFRRDKFRSDYWGASNERLQDHELWLNLLMLGRFVVTDETTCLYRLHDNNLSSGNQMRRQSEYEFLMMMMRTLLSDRFIAFYQGITDTNRRIRFAKAINSNLRSVTGYCAGVEIVQSALLERISLVERERPQEIHAMRVEVARSLGLYRKALSLRKLCAGHFVQDSDGLPYLVPAHADLPALVDALIEEGCFLDGAHIDFSTRQLAYFYACTEPHIDALRGYESFGEAMSQKRIVILDAASTGLHDHGFSIAKNEQLNHGLMDKLFKFFEEQHGALRTSRPMIG